MVAVPLGRVANVGLIGLKVGFDCFGLQTPLFQQIAIGAKNGP